MKLAEIKAALIEHCLFQGDECNDGLCPLIDDRTGFCTIGNPDSWELDFMANMEVGDE